MKNLRASNERGYVDHGWLKSYHTFSFGSYIDRKHVQFHNLRVINEDFIAGGKGFPPHPHRDMEIVTYMIDGALAHEDSMGNSMVIGKGEVQRMSAGTGIVHSEYNHLQDKEAHLLQIWILPNEQNRKPGYEQKEFTRDEKLNQFRLLVSPDGRDGSLSAGMDAEIYGSLWEEGTTLEYTLKRSGVWLQMVSGKVEVDGTVLETGDGYSTEENLEIKALVESEFILFDLD